MGKIGVVAAFLNLNIDPKTATVTFFLEMIFYPKYVPVTSFE